MNETQEIGVGTLVRFPLSRHEKQRVYRLAEFVPLGYWFLDPVEKVEGEQRMFLSDTTLRNPRITMLVDV